MKTLQNLKLNSSHLKTEIEKISNIIKRDKSPQESYIKIAQIKLNRKNDLDQMSMEAFIKSAKIGKKNKTELLFFFKLSLLF